MGYIFETPELILAKFSVLVFTYQPIHYMRLIIKPLLTLAFAFGVCLSTFAQGDLAEILKGSEADAQYLTEGYIAPFLRTYASGINQGWFNTAKPHKIAGIDITGSIALVSIPASDKSFTVDNSKLNNVYLLNNNNGSGNLNQATGSAQVPTAFGSATKPTYGNKLNNVVVPGTFEGPAGIDGFDEFLKGRVPVPVANIGLGLPKGIELKIRWTPEIEFGDGSIKMIGFGVMHDIKQYIPGIKMLPFDLSAMVAYSKLDLGVDFNSDGTQRGEFSVSGTTIQGMISKKIAVLTPYAALGYGFSSASLKVKGEYDLDEDPQTHGITDPVDMEEKVAGPRLTTGLRLKLLIFTFHADYTFQKYSTLTAGFGLSIR
jgi:hypothetical protein